MGIDIGFVIKSRSSSGGRDFHFCLSFAIHSLKYHFLFAFLSPCNILFVGDLSKQCTVTVEKITMSNGVKDSPGTVNRGILTQVIVRFGNSIYHLKKEALMQHI